MPFQDRAEAGRRLAKALAGYKRNNPIILALVRGGAPVAAEIARSLDAPLDVILVRKIGVPFHPELAMGAVVDGSSPLTVRNEDIIRAAGVSEADFAEARDRELAEIHRRRQRYLAGRAPINLAGGVVIVVDDGVATGATTRAALGAVRRQNPAKLILAIPVAASEVLHDLRDEADAIVCLEDYELFGWIGAYYRDFRQISDVEVINILAEFPVPPVRAA
ncbi:MAG TPA: phosphoribosyltransferase family protein [Roseiarcus sp.]|nr:phosphoribosyltransferase family protein [Roseiarcus sp.]